MTPFFKATLAALATLVLLLAGIFLNIAQASDATDLDKAPVYVPAGDGTLRMVGVYTNRRTDGYEVLACFAAEPNPRVVRCLVHSYADRVAFFIEVPASEGST